MRLADMHSLKNKILGVIEMLINTNDIDKFDLSNIMVVFGGTGDLTKRKLVPAIFNLWHEKKLPEKFSLVLVGRKDKTDEENRCEMYEWIKEFSRFKPDYNEWNLLSENIFYKKLDFVTDDVGYKHLKTFLDNLDMRYKTNGNRIFYLAVAPEFFDVITEKLNNCGMVENKTSWQRVVIEKPFGTDLKSAVTLNKKMTDIFDEKNIFRIDHYLGKDMVQNIMAIRFANALFEPLWNNKYIDSIQISSSETVGVETRGGYFEKAGIIKDMLQNHMLQLFALIAMEPPIDLDAESIRNEKVKALRSLKQFTPESVKKDVVRGQYGGGFTGNKSVAGYRQEERVSAESNTETFIALKLFVENSRWQGVPFYIRTGKRMPMKSTEIVIQFKQFCQVPYFQELFQHKANILVIKIQPEEGILLQINSKKPGADFKIIQVHMDFCKDCKNSYFENNSPESYEKLFIEIMKGNSTFFTRWDEVEQSWDFIERIERELKNEIPSFPNYKADTFGPDEADELLLKDGRKWWLTSH